MDQERSRRLESIFRHVPDDDLIDELGRRGRLKIASGEQEYFSDHADDAQYMRDLDRDIYERVARRLNNDLMLTWTERPVSATRVVRMAAVAVVTGDVPDGLQSM